MAAPSGTDKQVIDKFFAGWATFVQLPAGPVRAAVTKFIAAESPEERRSALEAVNPTGRILRAYAEFGILREAADPTGEILALSPAKLASAIRASATQEPLGLLQKYFEFGRTPPVPNQQAARTFLQEFLALAIGAPAMKYCIYAKGLPFSAGGKSHEEIARQFVAHGYGSGNPLCGGLIARRQPLIYEFDTSTTVFRSGIRPDEVKQGILKWIRATGGDDEKLALTHVTGSVH
jgi:hypothetical protein